LTENLVKSILITGGRGQLARELTNALNSGDTELGSIPDALRRAAVVAVDIDEMDITSLKDVRAMIQAAKPELVIHTAAFTNVDQCEIDPDGALLVNAVGARNVAMAAEEVGAKLIHISTDYVFSGKNQTPRNEWDICAPASVYGHTKHLGELYASRFASRHFIVRTAWLYGPHGRNFVNTILTLAKTKDTIRVVFDQEGNPTNTADLAHHLLKLAVTEEYGVYHCVGQGVCSWFEFACEIVRLAGLPCSVSSCTSEEYPRPAKRPAYSALENRMLRVTLGDETRPWKEALASFMHRYYSESGK
jgi:dTDP-4-dehydrorhamnose reductase